MPSDTPELLRFAYICPTLGSMTSQPVHAFDVRWTFGDRLRKIRRAVGVSQTEFARELGQGVKSLGAWESGTNEPRNAVAIAKRIELAYGIPATWTLGLDDNPGGPDPSTRKPSANTGRAARIVTLRPSTAGRTVLPAAA